MPLGETTRQALDLGILDALDVLERRPEQVGPLMDLVREYSSGAVSLQETVRRAVEFWRGQNALAHRTLKSHAIKSFSKNIHVIDKVLVHLNTVPPTQSALATLRTLRADPDPAVRQAFSSPAALLEAFEYGARRWGRVPGIEEPAVAPYVGPVSLVPRSPAPPSAAAASSEAPREPEGRQRHETEGKKEGKDPRQAETATTAGEDDGGTSRERARSTNAASAPAASANLPPRDSYESFIVYPNKSLPAYEQIRTGPYPSRPYLIGLLDTHLSPQSRRSLIGFEYVESERNTLRRSPVCRVFLTRDADVHRRTVLGDYALFVET